MGYGDTFTTALSNARRNAAISGRPLSQNETTAITAGFANTADERAARLMALTESKRSNQAAELLSRQRLEEEKRQFEVQQKQQEKASIGGMVLGGATIGAQVAGPYGAVIGAGVGGVTAGLTTGTSEQKKGFIMGSLLSTDPILSFVGRNNSVLCTRVKDADRLSITEAKALLKLFAYARRYHPAIITLYQTTAPHYRVSIDDIRQRLIIPVVMFITKGQIATAYSIYKGVCKAMAVTSGVWQPEMQEVYGNG